MDLCRMGPPVELILEILSSISIKNFVETGTYEGNTAVWASEIFKKVLTSKFSERFYQATFDKFKHIENIEFVFGDSRIQLEKILFEKFIT